MYSFFESYILPNLFTIILFFIIAMFLAIRYYLKQENQTKKKQKRKKKKSYNIDYGKSQPLVEQNNNIPIVVDDDEDEINSDSDVYQLDKAYQNLIEENNNNNQYSNQMIQEMINNDKSKLAFNTLAQMVGR